MLSERVNASGSTYDTSTGVVLQRRRSCKMRLTKKTASLALVLHRLAGVERGSCSCLALALRVPAGIRRDHVCRLAIGDRQRERTSQTADRVDVKSNEFRFWYEMSCIFPGKVFQGEGNSSLPRAGFGRAGLCGGVASLNREIWWSKSRLRVRQAVGR